MHSVISPLGKNLQAFSLCEVLSHAFSNLSSFTCFSKLAFQIQWMPSAAALAASQTSMHSASPSNSQQLPATPSISQQDSQQRLKCLKLESIPCLTSGLRTTLNARKQRRGARLEVEQSACTYKYNVTVSRICVAL